MVESGVEIAEPEESRFRVEWRLLGQKRAGCVEERLLSQSRVG